MYFTTILLVGFYSPEYNASESDGSVGIMVGLLTGVLRGEIELSLRVSTPTDGNKYQVTYYAHAHTRTILYFIRSYY